MEKQMDFITEAYHVLSTMRLEAEGAIKLFEDEAVLLYKDGKQAGYQEAAMAFDTIGTALYNMRTNIAELQKACTHGKRADG